MLTWPDLQRMSRAEQRKLQDHLLHRYVREYLYPFSPFYRQLFDKSGVRPDQIRTVDDLRRLPLAPGEEERLDALLGEGEVRAEVDALGPTTVQETLYPGVWLITHCNAEGATVARFIEVTRIPELLRSQQEDIDVGIRRLEKELEN